MSTLDGPVGLAPAGRLAVQADAPAAVAGGAGVVVPAGPAQPAGSPATRVVLPVDEFGLITLIDHAPGHGGNLAGFGTRVTWCACPLRRVPPADVPAARTDVARHDHGRHPFTTGGYRELAPGRVGHGPVLTCRCPDAL